MKKSSKMSATPVPSSSKEKKAGSGKGSGKHPMGYSTEGKTKGKGGKSNLK